jgi:hypothetical protein
MNNQEEEKFEKEFCYHDESGKGYCDIKGSLPPTVSLNDIKSFITKNYISRAELKRAWDEFWGDESKIAFSDIVGYNHEGKNIEVPHPEWKEEFWKDFEKILNR